MRWATFQKLVTVEETLYGIPWALLGAILPFAQKSYRLQHLWQRGDLWLWIPLAFIAARVAGMSFNRVLDRHIDAQNPRTQNRVLPQGEASVPAVAWIAWTSLILFMWVCAQINILCFSLSPAIALLIATYPYAKRFTALSHLWVGIILGLAPCMAWMAMTESFAWPPVFFGLSLVCIITANDIIYACADIEFDRKRGLHSIPALLGQRGAWNLAAILHAGSLSFLLIGGNSLSLSFLFYGGFALVVGCLIYHYSKAKRRSTMENARAFLRSNAFIALVVFVATFGDILWNALS